ncbi:MAG TPA: alpha/beta hydrolase [Acidimicrobiales bacterium]|nr:alpha/beta hydrolase [Acidimicrobiales bacterium]
MLHFERHGSGAPLVLVHGITESLRAWDPLLDALSANHDVVALDLRGHGTSPAGGPYDVLSLAADVHEVVTSLGVDGPLLVGHSLGATVVSAYAAMFASVGVLNLDQPLRLSGFQASLQSLEPMLRGDRASFEAAMTMVFNSMRGQLDDPQWARLGALRRFDQDVVLAIWSSVFELEPADLEAMVESMTRAIAVPYLAVCGTDPGEGYEQWLTALVPDAIVQRWEGRGHYPHLVEPERFLAALAEFEGSIAGT